jgi:hypothetical protein
VVGHRCLQRTYPQKLLTKTQLAAILLQVRTVE